MEMILQRAAESILQAGTFLLPELSLSFYSDKEPILLSDPKRIGVDSCIVSDGCLQLVSGGKPLLVAINPDEALTEKLMESDVSSLSVWVDVTENLAQQVVDGFANKSWLYNSFAHKVFGRFLSEADKLSVEKSGERQTVWKCPIETRVFRGKAYANFKHDCLGCMFCVDASEEGILYCTGRKRLAELDDFKRTLEERKQKYDEFLQPDKTGIVASGICPQCGGQLIEKNGEKGTFLGCSHYPFCHFTAEKGPKGILFNF